MHDRQSDGSGAGTGNSLQYRSTGEVCTVECSVRSSFDHSGLIHPRDLKHPLQPTATHTSVPGSVNISNFTCDMTEDCFDRSRSLVVHIACRQSTSGQMTYCPELLPAYGS